MKTIDYFRYSTAVWLTSLFVSPAILMVLMEGRDLFERPLSGLGFLFLALLFGGFYSVPNWLLLTAGVAVADRLPWSEPARRLVIQLWATLLTFGLFALFNGGDLLRGEGSDLLFPLSYFVTISFGIWTYDLANPEREKEREWVG